MVVDWSELQACGGYASAAQVPAAIEMLFSASEGERDRAYWKIDNYVVVQGGLYESAVYAARLLVDRLKASPSSLNTEILDLLFELANGKASGKKVEHGPLKGELIEQLCIGTVAEAMPILSALYPNASERDKATIEDIREACQDAGL